MKKNQFQKKMVLSRETLRNLAASELGVAGGATTNCTGGTALSDCHCTNATTCTSLAC